MLQGSEIKTSCLLWLLQIGVGILLSVTVSVNTPLVSASEGPIWRDFLAWDRLSEGGKYLGEDTSACSNCVSI